MNVSDCHSYRTVIRISLWISVIVAISSCATVSHVSRPELSSAPLPSYRNGTTFVYADGRWETVLDVSPTRVTWIDHRKCISIGSPDFTYRRSKWETDTHKGTRQYELRADLFQKSKTTVWPLRVGNTAQYSESGVSKDKAGNEKSYRTSWSCEVVGTERISVIAGDFDTWKITCRRYYISKSRSKSHIRVEKSWYYAPDIGHYVLATSKFYYDKKSQRRELLAVLPPVNELSDGARHRMESSFQHALEFKKSGETVRWSQPELKFSGEIMPVGTFKTSDGSYSRQYVQKVNMPEGQRIYYGMAVRSAGGEWLVPRRQ